jgi:hypothetical protein
MYRAVALKHPLVSEFGVGLDWQELQHLVLSDRHAEAAARRVAVFLQQNTKGGKEIFALKDTGSVGKPTFEFARKFAGDAEALMGLWKEEHDAAEERMDDHWRCVQEKQARARELRESIAAATTAANHAESSYRMKKAAEESLSAHQYERVSPYRKNSPYTDRHYEWQRAKGSADSAKSDWDSKLYALQALENDLERTLVPPDIVVQPLPRDRGRALEWLFFMYLQRVAVDLYRLARMCFCAQQVFCLPLPADWKSRMKVPPTCCSLAPSMHAVRQCASMLSNIASALCDALYYL